MNRAAFEMMGQPEALQLLFDRSRKLVGFQKAKLGDRAAYAVRKAPHSDTYAMSGKAFANFYDIDIAETRRYLLQMYGDTPGVDLNMPDATSNRATHRTR